MKVHSLNYNVSIISLIGVAVAFLAVVAGLSGLLALDVFPAGTVGPLIAITLGTLGVAGIFYVWLAVSWTKPLAAFINKVQKGIAPPEHELAVVLERALKLPLNCFFMSVACWVVGAVVIFWFSVAVLDIALWRAGVLVCTGLCAGLIAPLVTFFALRTHAMALVIDEVSRFDFDIESVLENSRVSIMVEVLVSFLIFGTFTLGSIGFIGYAFNRQALVELKAESMIDRLAKATAQIRLSPFDTGEKALLSEKIEGYTFDPAETLFIIDESGSALVGKPPQELPPQLLDVLHEKRGFVIDQTSGDIYTYFAMKHSGGYLVGHYPWERLKERLNNLVYVFGPIILFLIVMAYTITRLLTSNLLNPIRGLAESARKAAGGDLDVSINIFGGDEAGELALRMRQMVKSVGRLVDECSDSSTGIKTEMGRLDGDASGLDDAAKEQERLSEAIDNLAAELGKALSDANRRVSELSTTAAQINTDAFSMVGSIEGVSGSSAVVGDAFNKGISRVGEMGRSLERTISGIGELQNAVGRTAATASAIASTIGEISNSARKATAIAAGVGEEADRGVEAVESTIAGIDNIRSFTKNAAESIFSLGHQITQIGKILGVIEGIAKQTNLLSLNASIIAAAAGEHGKSFAVVAEEIGELAEKTSSSTKEISALIGNLQERSREAISVIESGLENVSDGVTLANKAGETLSRIQQSSRETTAYVKKIADTAAGYALDSEELESAGESIKARVGTMEAEVLTQQKTTQDFERIFKDGRDMLSSIEKAVDAYSNTGTSINSGVERLVEVAGVIEETLADKEGDVEQLRQQVQRLKKLADDNAGRIDRQRQIMGTLSNQAERLRNRLDLFKQ